MSMKALPPAGARSKEPPPGNSMALWSHFIKKKGGGGQLPTEGKPGMVSHCTGVCLRCNDTPYRDPPFCGVRWFLWQWVSQDQAWNSPVLTPAHIHFSQSQSSRKISLRRHSHHKQRSPELWSLLEVHTGQKEPRSCVRPNLWLPKQGHGLMNHLVHSQTEYCMLQYNSWLYSWGSLLLEIDSPSSPKQ